MTRRGFLKALGAALALVVLPVPKPKYPPLFHITSNIKVTEEDVWESIVNDPEFCAYFDVVSKHDIVMSGHVGSILGDHIITDGFSNGRISHFAGIAG